MSKIQTYLLALVLLLTGGRLIAQTSGSTNSFALTIAPATNVVMIMETTNLLTVAFSNMAITNQEVVTDPVDPTITTTNDVVSLRFSNVIVTASFPVGTNIDLRDNGVAPDATNRDYTYSANWIVPTNLTGTNVLIRYNIRGIDVTSSNDTGVVTPVNVSTNITVSYRLVSRPPNDRFTNAFKIASDGGFIVASNNFASLEPSEPKHGRLPAPDASVWWVWSSPITTNVLVDTAGSDFKTVLAVYTLTNVPSGKPATVSNLLEVASAGDDLVNKLRAHVNFNAQAGVSYRIAVAGQDTNSVGNIRLHIAPGGLPDTHPPSVTISYPNKETLTTTESVYIYGVAKEPILTDSGISNVVIQVNSAPATNRVNGTDSWYSILTVPAGTNVIRAYAVDYAGNVGIADSIVVRYVNPTNDNFVDAIALTGVGDLVTAINGRATIEPGEPLKAGNIGGHSIWYSWRAPNTGQLTLSTVGSDFDTVMGVYVGTNVANLITINGNDDLYSGSGYSELTQDVLSNQVYYVAIDGYGGASGNVMLQYAFTAPVPSQYYRLTTKTTAGGTVSPPSGLYLAGSRVTLTATPQDQFLFSKWEGDVASSQNPFTVTITSDLTVTARFQLNVSTGNTNNITDDFESGGLKQMPWSNSTNAPWTIQTNWVKGGKYAARSGPVGDAQYSMLSLTTNTTIGVGSFDVMVSSEQSWDFLEFSVIHYEGAKTTTNVLNHWSGETGWTNYIFNIAAGTNTFIWKYVKDNSFSGGMDAAFIDNIYVPLAQPSGPAGAATLILVYTPDDQAQITVQGQPNRVYLLEASTDLVVWLPIASQTSSGTGIAQFLDADANIYPRRYYRTSAQ